MSSELSFSARLAELEQADGIVLGGRESRLSAPTKDTLLGVISEVLPVRFNLLTRRIERNGEPIGGDFLNTLHLVLAEEFKLNVSKDNAADAAIIVAERNAYHPVRDYLNSLRDPLPASDWSALADRCFAVPEAAATLHLQRQLIGLVARAMRPGCKLHTCLVLQSTEQGNGKSSFWATLGGEWFSDSLGDLRNLKDDQLILHSAWLHEWGEIDCVLGKRESEAIKRFLSASFDDVRKPYARVTDRLQRSCGIVGTTNRLDFIKDFTGNRRFPIIPVRAVNSEWVEEHRDQIWCSAFQAFNAGERWHYERDEIDQINKAAMAFAASDPLLEHLESVLEDHPGVNEVCVAQALVWMGRCDERRDAKVTRPLARCFQQLGWTPTPARRRYTLDNGVTTDKTTGWIKPPE
jgi:predicted P-loop ATPase